jgi:hypothetical protein
MKCAACNRELSKPAWQVAGLSYGPVCFRRMFPVQRRTRKTEVVIIDENQLCFFDRQGQIDKQLLEQNHANETTTL